MAKEPALSDEADDMQELSRKHFHRSHQTEGAESMHHRNAHEAYDSASVNYHAGNESVGNPARKSGDYHAGCAYGRGACMHYHGEGKPYGEK